MREESDVPFAGLTTLRVGGPARRLVTVETEDDVVAVVTSVDAAGEPLLVLGGGSNLVVADEGFEGTVLRVATAAPLAVPRDDGVVELAAGLDWDQTVGLVVEQGLSGVEALSGIPGLVGGAPIQNIGAYGQEVSQTVSAVRALDRATGQVVTLGREECRFAYRDSVFKGSDRYVVLTVALALERSRLGAPVTYDELARTLGVPVGERVPAADVRAAVLDLRRRKGMVVEPPGPDGTADHDTWSAGSFFTNPVLTAGDAERLLPPEAPRWPQPDGQVKASAAWLIEQSGFGRGYGSGRAALSTRHTLAVTNRGGATTREVLDLARELRDGVEARFGVRLVPEPVLVGVTL